MTEEPPSAVTLRAPAKLTVSLQVTGVRPDGFHELRAEMVSVDLADELVVDPSGDGLEIDIAGLPTGGTAVDAGPGNLVQRALRAVGRTAHVRLCKRIPVGGGLGGGSTDAGAVLRWAGVDDPALAAGLGADVPFCVHGGRALVTGIGEQVSPLPFERQTFVLLLPPFGVDTAAVYRAWDRRPATGAGVNDLEAPALAVEPRLGRWRDVLAEATGQVPSLAGSGSTWFVAGEPEELGVAGRATLSDGGEDAPLVVVRSVPAGWGTGPTG